MEKTNNINNTQNNANETSKDFVSHVIAGYGNLLNDTAELVKAKEELTKANDILENRLAKVAENFLQEQVQDVIYKTHQQEAFRETIESNYAKVSDLWHTLDDEQKELLSDMLHGLGVSTGMLLSEVFKAGIKACYTHGETLESLNNLETVNVSKVFYDALPTDRY